MLFIHTWQLVVEGKKTLTTRRAHKNAEGQHVCRYVAGRTYAVQKEWMGRSIARIEITDVRFRELVRDISDDDARAEGFKSTEKFIELYSKAFGAKSLDKPAFGIRFVLNSTEGK